MEKMADSPSPIVEITGIPDFGTVLEYAADTSAEAYAGIEGVDGSVSEEGGIPG